MRSGFQTFVIANFNNIVSTFRDWFRRIGINQRARRVGVPVLPLLCRSPLAQSTSLVIKGR